eukprot:CAMPEP_0177661394 /NCGR_PEP_ID=MMETSP0447-20121125/18656_1 /TAXON_ID=0 /ORGANISM="Stygamoeba regulata, Strain BSH-02190019" /LENGTH=401 /DNA_ID=CAMNT_0019166735 /DNA_START=89 /DNA_END=1294 /DNA_ORIENTATION=-
MRIHLALLLSAVLLQCAAAITRTSSTPTTGTVVDVINQQGCTILAKWLDAAGLTATLQDPKGTFTVFAPTNTAFHNLPPSVVKELLNNTTMLHNFLLHHVAPKVYLYSDMADDELIQTLTDHADKNVRINKYANGLATVDGEPLRQQDFVGSNGVVHLITDVLHPIETDIVQAAVGTADLSKLVALLKKYDLVDALSGAGPFTVFAPSNAAFEAARPMDGSLSAADMKAVLLYHVVPGTFFSAAAYDTPLQLKTLQGATVEVALDEETGMMALNGATAHPANTTATNLAQSNGVVHVINAVLQPPLGPSSTSSESSQSSQPASSAPASSAPASSAPASSAPASSAPASTSSKTASSAPASTLPASTHAASSTKTASTNAASGLATPAAAFAAVLAALAVAM